MARSINELEKEHRRLAASLAELGYMAQGSVFERKKGPGSRFQWTWKNKKQKTESLTLTAEQYDWLKKAVSNHRRAGRILSKMRGISEQIFARTVGLNNPRK